MPLVTTPCAYIDIDKNVNHYQLRASSHQQTVGIPTAFWSNQSLQRQPSFRRTHKRCCSNPICIALWDKLVVPHRCVRMILDGHAVSSYHTSSMFQFLYKSMSRKNGTLITSFSWQLVQRMVCICIHLWSNLERLEVRPWDDVAMFKL